MAGTGIPKPILEQVESQRYRDISFFLLKFGWSQAALWVILTVFLGVPGGILAATIAFVSYTIAFLVYSPGRRVLATAIWVVGTNCAVLAGTFIVHPLGHTSFLFMSVTGLPFVVFSIRRQLPLLVSFVALPIVLWFVSFAIGLTWPADVEFQIGPENAKLFIAPLVGFTVFASICFQIGYFAVVSMRYSHAAEASRRAAERASSAKTAFMSGISHEMRTPLNAIIGLSELLETEGGDRPGDKYGSYGGQIKSAGYDLLKMLERVMRFSDLLSHASELEVTTIKVADALQTAILRHRSEAEHINATLLVRNAAGFVFANEVALNEALDQLFENAIKYAGPKSEILLRADKGDRKNAVRLYVSDNGPGFAPKDIQAAFAPFERLGHATGTTFGAGMGLPIARLLTEAMGGKIGIEKSESGASVWIELREAPAPVDHIISPKT